MAETITHAFVSAKPDSSDTTLVSSSEWNDGHVFSGGLNGQFLIYDNTQPNNMRWVDGVNVYTVGETVTNPTASPVTDLATVNLTCSTRVLMLVTITYRAETVGAVTYTLEYFIDGVLGAFYGGIPSISAADISQVFFSYLTPGAHSTFMRITSTGGVNFTNGFIQQRTLTIGSI